MSEDAETDVERFGRVVQARREERGWSQEALAAAAFPGSTNKGYISRIENGKVPKITRETVKSVASALRITVDEVPFSLRWSGALKEVMDTNTVVHKIHSDVERLLVAEGGRAREFGIKEGMLIALAQRYAEGDPKNFNAALAGLERALESVREERKRVGPSPIFGKAVDAALIRIDALNDEGSFEEGQAALEAELMALDEEDKDRKAARIRFLEKGVAQSILTRSATNACRFVIARFELEAPIDPEKRFQALQTIFNEWYQRGEDMGLNLDLKVASLLARELIGRAKTIEHRGTANDNLGLALLSLGERQNDKEQLNEAVQSFHAALANRTLEHNPSEWAATQNNLGNALSCLGVCERYTDPVPLEEAVQIFHAVLEVCTRERAPLAWASTQNNLGIAHSSLMEYDDAAKAYCAALKEYTLEREPLNWATTQNNLGNALLGVGNHQEAIQAFRSALKERTRERLPLEWAATQHNLGRALYDLGELESDPIQFELAAQAYRAALKEYTYERTPLLWRETQNNLGIVLSDHAICVNNPKLLEEAILAFHCVLQEFNRERSKFDWAATHCNLGIALTNLADMEVEPSYLAEATSHLDAALTAFMEIEEVSFADLVRIHLKTNRELKRELAKQKKDRGI